MTNDEIIHAVCVLNLEAAEALDAEFYGLTFECDGTCAYVKFLNIYIWLEDDDERTFDATTATREPLLTFLRRRLNEEICKLVCARDRWCDNVVPPASEPSKPAVQRLAPSGVSRNFECTFGWSELEQAAARIVEVCLENGDTFDTTVVASDMENDEEANGFSALIAHGYLRQPDLGGRGGPCLFSVTDEFVLRLRQKALKCVE